MTPDLFQKYINGTCSEQERMTIEQFLQECTEEEADHLFAAYWSDTGEPEMPAEQTSRLWKRLGLATGQRLAPVSVAIRISVAAAVIAAIAISTFRAIDHQGTHPEKTAISKTENVQLVQIANDKEQDMKILLDDGSEVQLKRNSKLQYRQGFSIEKREIHLEGTAIFSVAKDASRPFTVFSRNITATALGTRFIVEQRGDTAIRVKLFEGKLAVNNAGKQKILLPEDELVYYARTSELIATNDIKRKHIVKTRQPITNQGHYNFKNERLEKVLDAISKKFNTAIIYNQEDIKDLHFTGDISGSNSLPRLLNFITKMNELQLREEPGRYVIHK